MNRKDFATCLAMVESAVHTPLDQHSAETYWDLLRDLPLDVFRLACKRVILSHGYKSFPLVSELRQAASETILGQVAELPPAEAWRIAKEIAARFDPDVSGSYYKGGKEYASQIAAYMDGVPGIVAKTMRQIGMRSLAHDLESVVRTQFMKAFEQNVVAHKKLAMMPVALKKEIEQKAALPIAARALNQIGVEKP